MNPLNHTQARQLLQAAADYRLEPAEQVALDAHLAGCPDCRAYGEGIGTLEQGLRKMFHRQWDQPAARGINLLPGVRLGYRRRHGHHHDKSATARSREGGAPINVLFDPLAPAQRGEG